MKSYENGFRKGDMMYGQFFLLFALIIVGYYCNKKGWLNRETNKNMSSMVMHVTIPAMLITTIAQQPPLRITKMAHGLCHIPGTPKRPLIKWLAYIKNYQKL